MSGGDFISVKGIDGNRSGPQLEVIKLMEEPYETDRHDLNNNTGTSAMFKGS